MPQGAEWTADSELMTLFQLRPKAPRPKIGERPNHQRGPTCDDNRTDNALPGKQDRYTPREHGVRDAQVHHDECKHMNGEQRARKGRGGFLLRNRCGLGRTGVTRLT